jgi:NAD(P)-dependent dehydrogenase (short-subunit alcohol dehydrogenase family)
MNLLFLFSFLVAIIAIISYFYEQKAYAVHNSGIVLITGASTGIGRDAAEYLAVNSNFLVLAGVRKESDGKAIDEMNVPNLKSIRLDVTSHESCVEAVNVVKDLMSVRSLPFVGLVNNAGVVRMVPIEFHDIDDVKKVFETNFFGMLDITQLTLPLLRSSEGRIIMMSSAAGFVASPFTGVYSSSKFAMEAASDALRRELQSYGVSVSLVQPGYVKTNIVSSAVAETGDFMDAHQTRIVATYPKFEVQLNKQISRNSTDVPLTSTTPAILHALTSKYPKTRYPVARADDLSVTGVSWVMWLLSDRLEDKIVH